MHVFLDLSVTLEQLVIFALLFVLTCVWTVPLARAWRARH